MKISRPAWKSRELRATRLYIATLRYGRSNTVTNRALDVHQSAGHACNDMNILPLQYEEDIRVYEVLPD